jgi:hypothetical protein
VLSFVLFRMLLEIMSVVVDFAVVLLEEEEVLLVVSGVLGVTGAGLRIEVVVDFLLLL